LRATFFPAKLKKKKQDKKMKRRKKEKFRANETPNKNKSAQNER